MNKKVKITLVFIGLIGLSYGAWKLADYITGTIRLKYATYKVKKFEEPAISSEDIE